MKIVYKNLISLNFKITERKLKFKVIICEIERK